MGEVLAQPKQRIGLIREALAVLEAKYGFACVATTGEIVRFENRFLFVTVHHGACEKGLDLSFGPLKGPRQSRDTFYAREFFELVRPGGFAALLAQPAPDWSVFQQVLKAIMDFLLTTGAAILRCDQPTFERLANARKQREESAASERIRELVQGAKADVKVYDALSLDALSSRPPPERQPAPDRLAALERVESEAQKMLSVFLDPARRESWQERVNSWEPHPMDYDRVFNYTIVENVRQVFTAVWSRPMQPPLPRPGQNNLRVAACYASWLATDAPQARRFPRGFSQIAPLLEPDLIWLVWKYFGPKDPQGSMFSGLVWLDNCWAWFPDPYEVIESDGAPDE